MLSLAQGDYGSLLGDVRTANGSPGRTLVELQLHGSTISTTYTDDSGGFGFSGLNANDYHVVVRDERFNLADVEARVDPGLSPTTAVHLLLTTRARGAVDTSNRMAGANPYIIDLSEYKRHFPKSAVKEFDKGVDADKDHRTDDAIRHYEKAVSEAPDFYPARNNLGSDYLSKSNFPDAQKQFEESIRLNKDDSQAYFNLGNVFSLTGKPVEAEKALKEGLQKRPDSAFGHFLLGSLYSRAGQRVEAERNLQEALKLDPSMPQPYLQLVNLYLQEKRETEAITELQSFLHVFPDGPFTPKARQVLKKLQAEQRATVSR
jgi:tetratricopeptide (TPR) repeat protein